MCSATGSGHVITCTARRWVVSGRLYCFQRPPAEGRREACKPSTDPTSRITNVRINRTAAHRSIFRPAFAEPPCCTQSTAAASRHRQDEKSNRRRCVFSALHRRASSWRKIQSCFQIDLRRAALPSTGQKIPPKGHIYHVFSACTSLLYTKYSGGVSSSAGRKITPPRRTGSAP